MQQRIVVVLAAAVLTACGGREPAEASGADRAAPVERAAGDSAPDRASDARADAVRPAGAAPAEADVAERALPIPDPADVATPLVAVPAGTFTPPFEGKAGAGPIAVEAFALEEHAVTNAQFLAFVTAHPQWRRSRVAPLFAGDGYLAHWPADLDHGAGFADRPVTNVSWFAARAYAEWLGRRLPTIAEWELAAAAGRTAADGTEDPEYVQRILAWYSRPTRAVPEPVRSTFVNDHGLWDLHGLVWEWVEDFDSALVTGESRGDAGLDRDLFCGSGSIGAVDPSDYAAFMRYAFRQSLRPDYAVRSLGFRCAVSEQPACCVSTAPAAPLPGTSVWQLGSTWHDQHGRPVRLADLRGEVVVAAMFFSHCAYACPVLLQDLERLAARLDAGERAAVRFLLVSLDDERDTPDALREFADRHGLGERWTLLHGDAGAVRELAAVLGVRYQRTPSGDYAHSNLVAVLDAEGRLVHREPGLRSAHELTLATLRGLLQRR